MTRRARFVLEPTVPLEATDFEGWAHEIDPAVVHEAWCHQRSYVCMIEEFGGRPIKAGESFSAAFIVGYFDSIDEMHEVYDAHKGLTGLTVNEQGWDLTR